jgi:type II secretory ATPase GspE/PulE/Tfp pilus assembly ATPase PilB-like protein
MEALGLREKDLLKIFYEELKKPNGMIICTGPTGSGKTTPSMPFCKN